MNDHNVTEKLNPTAGEIATFMHRVSQVQGLNRIAHTVLLDMAIKLSFDEYRYYNQEDIIEILESTLVEKTRVSDKLSRAIKTIVNRGIASVNSTEPDHQAYLKLNKVFTPIAVTEDEINSDQFETQEFMQEFLLHAASMIELSVIDYKVLISAINQLSFTEYRELDMARSRTILRLEYILHNKAIQHLIDCGILLSNREGQNNTELLKLNPDF